MRQTQSPDHCISTVAEALTAANSRHGGTTTTAQGCDIESSSTQPLKEAAALALAKAADEVVLVLGFGHHQAREGKDPKDTTLPGQQGAFADKVMKLGKPTTIVLIGGGALAIDAQLSAQPGPGAIVQAFNIAFGTPALAASLFGEENRWGKLPISACYRLFPPCHLCALRCMSHRSNSTLNVVTHTHSDVPT
jgi:hypothetical protein